MNVPVPLVVQAPVPLPPVIIPASETEVTLAQTVVSIPAEAKPAGVIVIKIVSLTGAQGLLLVEVSTSITLPAIVSAGLKV